jgi:multiple sugar transport system permease protein
VIDAGLAGIDHLLYCMEESILKTVGVGSLSPQRMKLGSRSREHLRAVLFLFPTWILLLIFFFGPIFLTFYFAFTNMTLTGAASKDIHFIGIDNFLGIIADPSFSIVLLNTLVFLVLSAIIGQQALGLILALLMNNRNKSFRRLIGTIVLIGWVTPEIVVAFTFFAFLNDQGTLNTILGVFGIEPIKWLYQYPMASVIIANVWHGTAFSMLVFQAALSGVPPELEEAAMIDGANVWQRLWRITLPIIKGSIVTNMVLVSLQTLGVFTLIYALTGGGPGIQTETLPIFMYHQAFINFQLGYGTAISLVLLLIGMIVSVGYIRLLKVKI